MDLWQQIVSDSEDKLLDMAAYRNPGKLLTQSSLDRSNPPFTTTRAQREYVYIVPLKSQKERELDDASETSQRLPLHGPPSASDFCNNVKAKISVGL